MTLTTNLVTSCEPMAGGAAATTGTGEQHDFTIGGTWASGDTVSVILTDNLTGTQFLAGAGNISGKTPSFAFTFNQKEYLLADARAYFSVLADPTNFNTISELSNGFVEMSDQYASPDNLVAVTSFQGRLAFFSRNNVQIWSAPADPAEWALQQVFDFIGTRSKQSVKTVGDFEVFFLDETGVRSLRVRDNTLNAFSEDLGSPIDELIQAALVASSETQKDNACAIVEPSSKRYWLFLKDTIYVFSNFPSSKVAAWSKYSPTFNNGGAQTAFVPEKFVTFKGQVYCRAGDYFFIYGGSDNNTYDACVASWETPWLEAKTPGTRKVSKSLDVAISGGWKLEAGMDPRSGTLVEVFNDTASSFDIGTLPYSDRGTHFKLKGSTTGATAARVGMLAFHYEQGDE